ncbi:hypothetical protein B6S44_02420 [Bosea sp. Tri-44]|nr:hypothetical protein B6S44_02420 [Bosea sp. Tri-44]
MARMRSTPALLRFLQSTILAAVLGFGSASSTYALAALIRIDKPLPNDLKDRVTELLKRVRPADWEQAVAGSKVAWHASWSNTVLLRVEAGCFERQCMTLVGRLTDQAINLELTILADDTVSMHDVFNHFWGIESSPPWIFKTGGNTGLVAIQRDQGWLLTACSECTDWGDWRTTIIEPPLSKSPAPPELTFGEFSQKLKEMTR